MEDMIPALDKIPQDMWEPYEQTLTLIWRDDV